MFAQAAVLHVSGNMQHRDKQERKGQSVKKWEDWRGGKVKLLNYELKEG